MKADKGQYSSTPEICVLQTSLKKPRLARDRVGDDRNRADLKLCHSFKGLPRKAAPRDAQPRQIRRGYTGCAYIVTLIKFLT